jgi:uncharacterized protein (TIGR02246 family)
MRRHLIILFLASVLLFGCGGRVSGSPELTAEDVAAITDLRDALTNAIVAGDAATYASLCTEDVRLLHAGSPVITGREELEAHNAEIFEAISVISLKLTPVQLYGTGDLAYEVGTQELTITPEVPMFRGSRKYVHVFRRGSDDKWRFAALMSNNN